MESHFFQDHQDSWFWKGVCTEAWRARRLRSCSIDALDGCFSTRTAQGQRQPVCPHMSRTPPRSLLLGAGVDVFRRMAAFVLEKYLGVAFQSFPFANSIISHTCMAADILVNSLHTLLGFRMIPGPVPAGDISIFNLTFFPKQIPTKRVGAAKSLTLPCAQAF